MAKNALGRRGKDTRPAWKKEKDRKLAAAEKKASTKKIAKVGKSMETRGGTAAKPTKTVGGAVRATSRGMNKYRLTAMFNPATNLISGGAALIDYLRRP